MGTEWSIQPRNSNDDNTINRQFRKARQHPMYLRIMADFEAEENSSKDPISANQQLR